MLCNQSMMIVEKSSHCISWYDIITNELLARTRLAEYPHEFVIDSDYKYAYISHYGVRNSGIDGIAGRSVIVVDIATAKIVHTFDLGEHARPHGIGLDSFDRLYVLSEWTGHLLVKQNPRDFNSGFDYITPTGGKKSHLFAVHRNGRRAYSINLLSNDVTVFDPYAENTQPISIKTGNKPEGRCLRNDEKVLYITNRLDNTVTVIDTESLNILRNFATPQDPCRIFYDNKRNRLMTINHSGDSFSIFDESTGKQLYQQKTEANPVALCFDEQQAFAYIAMDCEKVIRFNLETFETVQTLKTLSEPDVMYILPKQITAIIRQHNQR